METVVSMRSLNQLALDEEARIRHIGGPGRRVRRIMALGLSPGAQVRLVRRAPLGDPLELAVAGCLLVLRSEEADTIFVEEP